jgi:hypothetical protein
MFEINIQFNKNLNTSTFFVLESDFDAILFKKINQETIKNNLFIYLFVVYLRTLFSVIKTIQRRIKCDT